MAGLLRGLLTLVAGVMLGLAATDLAVTRQPLFGAVRSGAWVTWPEAGSPKADPYVRAVYARDGRVPLATAVGLRFLATADDEGRPLDGRCAYSIGGPTPAAQYWTLALLDRSGFLPAGATGRSVITSAEVVRAADGGFAVTVARQARPGNWLPWAGEGRFQAMLSFYDSPLGTALLTGNPPPPLPAIVRTACG